ncbi:S41 family peptidase [Ferruginivarius sediminum]|nr:S41 family peptidase [Ferruginivarius sediminum]
MAPRKLPARAVRIAAFSMLVLAVACAGKEQNTVSGEYNSFEATRLFSVGYHDIADIYIEEVAMADLAVAGLREVAEMDPTVAVERHGDDLSMRVKGRETHVFPLPKSEDPDRWGSMTASALEAGQSYSPTLRNKSAEELYESMFEGMLVHLDPYSRYAGADRARENRANRDGFGGIGVRIGMVDAGIEILSVMQDSPAKSAGLAEGDVIVAIDGEPAAMLGRAEAVEKLRGRIDSRVALTVRREDLEYPVQIAVRRGHIVPQTVEYRREGDTAYIRVSGFNQNTAESMRRVIGKARRDIGPDLAGFVLDLRDNPGGLLDQAVDVSDLFVREGRIVSTHGRHPDSHQYFDADPDDLGEGRPVVVLVNAASASASEIVAAALQDSGRAVVIGSTSFGKGTVQTVLRLPNRGELTLTWARFHAPSGYALSRRGVLPDVCTSGKAEDFDDVLADLRHSRMTRQTRTHSAAYGDGQAGEEALEALRASCPGRRASPSLDLDVALRLIHDRELYRTAAGTVPAKLAQVHH